MAELIDEALLKKDDEPTPAENEQQEVRKEEAYKLPESLPVEVMQAIKTLISPYLNSENQKIGGVNGGIEAKNKNP